MFDAAVIDGAVLTNPVCLHVAAPGADKKDVQALSVEDLNALRSAVDAWMTKKRPGPEAESGHGRHRRPDARDRAAGSAKCSPCAGPTSNSVPPAESRPSAGRSRPRPGKGTYRKPSPKSDSAKRTVALPAFAIAVLVRRQSRNREPERRGLPHAQRHLAAGQQRRAPVAADPQGHRARLGNAPHVPQDGRDPDRPPGRLRRPPPACSATPPPRSPRSSTSRRPAIAD